MKQLLEALSELMGQAFEAAGYDAKYGRVKVSDRPDLCEFQCNGAMAAAKEYKKAPIMIANDVKEKISASEVFSEVNAVNPGFLNMMLSKPYLGEYVYNMSKADKYGVELPDKPKRILVDYGGPNVAKPLHVGHLRSAIIGESVKRICKYVGNEVIGDIHMGDWGLQIGLIITELKERKPELVYFDPDFTGEYPEDAPFTLSELEEIYPTASGKSKTDEEYKAKALEATYMLQHGFRGYTAIWKHIMKLSVADLKRNYNNLKVSFDWWKGESDADKYIAPMVEELKNKGFAYESEGAIVVDVKEDTDTKEIPPCMLLKSDGAALYTTTDLATLHERKLLFNPDQVVYVVDKRQEMHFIQVFRCAKKTGIIDADVSLDFLGFGTMNGKDGKPFKTRDGGVMRLETLISDINEEMYKKISGNHEVDEEEGRKTAAIVALAAVKYGDLSNQATKDYIFDIDKFTSFEGNTGPYILYTIVRIKSILSKFAGEGGDVSSLEIKAPVNASEKELMTAIAKFNSVIDAAYHELAPHKLCAYIYEVSEAFNHFYHENHIMTEEDSSKKEGWIALLSLTKGILETCIDLLGFEAPERM